MYTTHVPRIEPFPSEAAMACRSPHGVLVVLPRAINTPLTPYTVHRIGRPPAASHWGGLHLRWLSRIYGRLFTTAVAFMGGERGAPVGVGVGGAFC